MIKAETSRGNHREAEVDQHPAAIGLGKPRQPPDQWREQPVDITGGDRQEHQDRNRLRAAAGAAPGRRQWSYNQNPDSGEACGLVVIRWPAVVVVDPGVTHRVGSQPRQGTRPVEMQQPGALGLADLVERGVAELLDEGQQLRRRDQSGREAGHRQYDGRGELARSQSDRADDDVDGQGKAHVNRGFGVAGHELQSHGRREDGDRRRGALAQPPLSGGKRPRQ